MNHLLTLSTWQPPSHWLRVDTIDLHTGGEPLRVILSEIPGMPDGDVLEKRRWFAANRDHLRTALMLEPRGHADMYGAIVTASRIADLDVFFLHNEGYSTMCGHAVIALARLVAETRGGDTSRPIRLTAPCGPILARAHFAAGAYVRSSFRNVPSFAPLIDGQVDVPGLGAVRFDIAYGGAFYAIVDAQPLGLRLRSEEAGRLIDLGSRIKAAVAAAHPVRHPFEPELSFLYGTIFTGPPETPGHHSRNVCIFADGELDRSPTGSGVSARAALLHARVEARLGDGFVIESIIGTTMSVAIAEETDFGPYDAIIPEVGGTAHVTGRHSFCFDPDDPQRDGFRIGR